MSGYTSDAGRFWTGTPGAPAIKDAWGAFLNDNAQLIAQLATGLATVNIAGLLTYTLTASNAASDQSRPLMQDYTGALAGNCTVTIPNVNRWALARNSTTGGFSVILTSGGGTTATMPPDGAWRYYWCDGAGNVSLPNLVVGGWQTIATYSPAAVASQAIPLSTAFRKFRLNIDGLIGSSGGASLRVTLSSDGGATYKSTLYSYAYQSVGFGGTSAENSTGAPSFTVAPIITTLGISMTLEVYPGSASRGAGVYGTGISSANPASRLVTAGTWYGGTELMNYLLLAPTAGTITGTVILEGLL